MKRSYKQLAFVVVLILTLFPMFFTVQKRAPQENNHILPMQAPGFVTETQAGNSNIGTLLDSEAGISAYFESATPIDLNQVRGEFRTIEQETADYIIGSVPVPDYFEEYDAHVYVHRDGWILAYYLKDDPAIKIVDLKGKTVSTTNLKTIVQIIALTAGSAFTDVTYYDFRYPDATNLLIVSEAWYDGRDFTITIPGDFGYYERSWGQHGPSDVFYLDGIEIVNQAIWSGDDTHFGFLTVSQLLPDLIHTIQVGGPVYYGDNNTYGALVIVYRGQ